MTRLRAVLLSVAVLAPSLAAQAPLGAPVPMQLPHTASGTPHPITIEETLALREVTALALSPDGRQVAFALQQAHPEGNAYASAIFIAPTDVRPGTGPQATKLADVPDVAALQWTADGAAVTYVAPVRGARQVWRIPAAGGMPRRMTTVATGVGTGLAAERVTDFPPYALSPDGRYLAYFTWDTAAAVRAAAARWPASFVFDEASVESTLDVRNPPTWRIVPLHADLWLTDLRTGHTEHVWQMPGTMQVNPDPAGTIPPELAWAPDSHTIAIVYYPVLRPGEYFVRHVGLYTLADHAFRPVLSNVGWTLFPRWLPDGQGFVVRSEGRLRPGQPRNFSYYEYHVADSSLREVAAPTDLAAQAGRTLETQLHGRATRCTLSVGQRRVTCLFETPKTPPELAVADVGDSGQVAEARIVTALNPEYASIRLGEVNQLSWPWPGEHDDRPGATLIKPLDYVPGKHYPVLAMLYNQGDKNRFVAEAWTNWPVQAFAAKGYAVLLVNFPSDAYTPGDFASGKWAEAEGPVASVDSAVRRVIAMGIADTTRMGIMGWSWGSYVTSYLISHYPGRFQAAASSEGQIYNMSSYWIATGDVRRFFAAHVGGGPYPRYLDQWTQMSPTMTAHQVKIPVLQEYRTDNAGGFEFNVAVNSQGGAAEMVFYPNEVHVFQAPRNRLHSMYLNYDWFNFWLLGEEDPSPAKRAQYARWHAMRAKLTSSSATTGTAGE